MLRFFAGVAACFLLMTGAFLIWQSHAAQGPDFASAPPGRSSSFLTNAEPLKAPEASSKTREERRFGRFDKNKDGKVAAEEYLSGRRRNFEKLDLDHNGALSFQEYAAKGIEKFNAAGGRKGWLSPAEFLVTAPPAAKRKPGCSCQGRGRALVSADDGGDNGN